MPDRRLSVSAFTLLLLLEVIGTFGTECTCEPIPRPPQGLNLSLPADVMLAPDWSSQTGWFMGHLQSIEGNRTFGVLYLIAASASASGCPSEVAYAWAAVADSKTGIFSLALRWGQDAAKINSTASPYSLGDATWGLHQLPSSPDWTQTSFAVNGSGFSAALTLNATFPVQLMGRMGVASETSACLVEHIAVPRIQAVGSVDVPVGSGSSESVPVKGTMWFQNMMFGGSTGAYPTHLWVNFELSDGWSGQFVQNLYDGVMTNNSYGNLVSPGGLNNTELKFPEFNCESWSPWVSPVTGKSYNTSARLSAPSFGLDLTFTTYIADNEIMLGPVPFIYEGVASVVGTHLGSPVAGNGFVEWFLYAGDNMFQV